MTTTFPYASRYHGSIERQNRLESAHEELRDEFEEHVSHGLDAPLVKRPDYTLTVTDWLSEFTPHTARATLLRACAEALKLRRDESLVADTLREFVRQVATEYADEQVDEQFRSTEEE